MKQFKKCVICDNIFLKPIHCSKKDWKERMSCSKKCGYIYRSKINIIWNKGLTKETDKRVKELSERQTGIKKDFSNYKGKKHHFWGAKHTNTTKKKMSISHQGEKHWNWQNGKTELVMQIRNSSEYKEWRTKVFKRDDFTCQKCGSDRSGDLEAHHIEFLSVIIEKYQIKTLDDALKCKRLWEIENGITLCEKCHRKIKHLIIH